MITAFEYNPSQVYFKQGYGGIHTGNYITSDGTFHNRPNSSGWTTICYGDMEQIDALTDSIQPLIYKLSKEAHRPISPDAVNQLVTSLLPQFPDIKMFE